MAWIRVRYDDQGRDLSPALRYLDQVAADEVRVLWVMTRGNPALLISTSDERQAVVAQGLREHLPGARLVNEAPESFLAGLKYAHAIQGPPPSVLLPVCLCGWNDVGVQMTWKEGRLSLCLFTNDPRAPAGARLAQVWAGAHLRLVTWPWKTLAGLPSSYFSLPPAADYPTLAARNLSETAFARAHDQGIVIGSDVAGHAVCVARPLRVVWVGDKARVGAVCAGLAGQWDGQVVVLDALSLSRGWADAAPGPQIAWAYPGRSLRLNPLAYLGHDTPDGYVGRVMAWASACGLSRATVGDEGLAGLRLLVSAAAAAEGELSPGHLLGLLAGPESASERLAGAVAQLSEREQALWQTRDWQRDGGLLAPAGRALRGVLDRSPELVELWRPPYARLEHVRDAGRVVVQAPRDQPAGRLYWAGMGPLFEALFGRPESLVLAFGLESEGKAVLGWGSGGASVVVYGVSAKQAVASARVDARPDQATGVDLVVGAGVAPAAFAAQLGVAPAVLASLDGEQAIACLDGDVGSLRLRQPKALKARARAPGWTVGQGLGLSGCLALAGDEEAAQQAVRVLCEQVGGRRVLVMGKRGVWDPLAGLSGAQMVPADELPALNPLERRDKRDLARWLWWGQGLDLPPDLLKNAYAHGVGSLPELLAYLQTADAAQALALVREAVSTGYFGPSDPDADPRGWFAHGRVLAVECHHPFITRYLALVALEAGAHVVVWQAPGLAAADLPLLQKAHSVLYPAPPWAGDLLVVRCTHGRAASLPDRVARLAAKLADGEGVVYRPQRGQCFKVVLHG